VAGKASAPLTEADRDLIRQAEGLIRARYRRGLHELASAVRTRDGQVFRGLHIQGPASGLDVCAEVSALAVALSQTASPVETVVTVKYDPEGDRVLVVPPCGSCRELLSGLDRGIQVIYSDGYRLRKAPVRRLLPAFYPEVKQRLRARRRPS